MKGNYMTSGQGDVIIALITAIYITQIFELVTRAF